MDSARAGLSPAARPPRPRCRDGEARLLAARRAASAALVMALCFSLAAGADGPQAAAQQPAREQRREEIRKEQKPGTVGKVIIQWDHLVDSNDKTWEDFWAFVAYKQAHFQLWSGEFTDGAEIGGYLKDHRRSAYAGLYRFRDDFDHVLQFDTEQVLKKGWVLAAMLRGIRIIDFDAKEQAAALSGEDIGARNELQFGTGFDWYHLDFNFMSLRAISDPREGGRWSFILSERLHHGADIYVQPGLIMRTDNSTGWFLQGKVKYFRWGVGKYDRFDFTDVDRTIYSAGVEIPF